MGTVPLSMDPAGAQTRTSGDLRALFVFRSPSRHTAEDYGREDRSSAVFAQSMA